MPKDFDACVSGGGGVRTIKGPSKSHGLGKGEYIHYCFKNGESFRGEVKTAQKKKK